MDYSLPTSNNKSTNAKVNDEVKALKEDMQHLLTRLGTLSQQSKEAMKEQFGDMMSKLNDLSDQGMQRGKAIYSDAEDYIKDRPMTSTLYAFLAGVVVTALLKR